MATRHSICNISLHVERMKSELGRYRLINNKLNILTITKDVSIQQSKDHALVMYMYNMYHAIISQSVPAVQC